MSYSENEKEKKSRLFDYLMKLAVDNPNHYVLGKKVREFAIKKGYIYDKTRDPEQS